MAWTKKESIKLVFHFGAMTLIIGVIALAFFYLYLPRTTNHGETITVPNVVGRTANELDEFLIQKNLRFEVVPDSGYSSELPALSVLKQFPEGDTKVKENRKIYVTLNAKRAPMLEMPNLVDGSLKYAEDHLKSVGLKLGRRIYKPDRAENAILQQLYKGKVIKAGTSIAKGSEIDLVVGDGIGKDKFQLSNYLDVAVDEAIVAIEGANLTVGSIFYVSEVDSLSGRVLRQSPAAGQRIREGEAVDLWVANYSAQEFTKAD